MAYIWNGEQGRFVFCNLNWWGNKFGERRVIFLCRKVEMPNEYYDGGSW